MMNYNKDDLRFEVVEIAQNILANSLDAIVGFRRLTRFQKNFRHLNEFDAFVALESETDIFPRGRQRELFNESYLRDLDLEESRYLELSKSHIEQSCKDLIRAVTADRS